ncbi:MAG: hypothetical protein WCO84_03490 [bacterium]
MKNFVVSEDDSVGFRDQSENQLLRDGKAIVGKTIGSQGKERKVTVWRPIEGGKLKGTFNSSFKPAGNRNKKVVLTHGINEEIASTVASGLMTEEISKNGDFKRTVIKEVGGIELRTDIKVVYERSR